MECVSCGQEVDPERAEFLAESGRQVSCIHCTNELPRVCFMDYSHKTAPSLVIVGTKAESIRLATRAFKRKR